MISCKDLQRIVKDVQSDNAEHSRGDEILARISPVLVRVAYSGYRVWPADLWEGHGSEWRDWKQDDLEWFRCREYVIWHLITVQGLTVVVHPDNPNVVEIRWN
jgi:hypothetical protein